MLRNSLLARLRACAVIAAAASIAPVLAGAAADASPQGGSELRAKHGELRPSLERNHFGRAQGGNQQGNEAARRKPKTT